ncbi:MAG: VCBS repeat-containing protein [Bryobacterales bacterium]|jgi:hypothetical protein|nr:VCBS repeat-containing protein [Bryobacterales bacterium]
MPCCWVRFVWGLLFAALLTAQPVRMQELLGQSSTFMAVLVEDVNGDGKPDIVAAQEHRIVWFENPGWQMHTLADDTMAKNYVCLAAQDIDGDGSLDFAVGSAWRPADRKTGGVIQWMRRSEPTGRALWKAFPITEEPTTHRMRWADVTGDGKPELLVAPLHGRALGDDPADEPLRLLVLTPPAQPETQPWRMEVANSSLHVMHNLAPLAWKGHAAEALASAAREGLHLHRRSADGQWRQDLLGQGNPGEIKFGMLGGTRVAATIQPWHGNGLVVYRETRQLPWPREVLDESLEEGHAIAWADLDGDGVDELIAGWRRGSYGVAVYRLREDGGWAKTVIDREMATEDIAVADLNGNGLPEIVAVGRATGNVRIYWNQAKPQWVAHRVAAGFANHTIVAGDLTGSPRLDIVVSGHDETYLLAGDAAGTKRVLQQGIGGLFASELMDVDGDGDLDFVAARYSPGLIFWLERPANPLTDAWVYHEIDDFAKGGVNGIHGLLVGDVDGDGLPDLIANSAQPNGAFPNSLAWFQLRRQPGGAHFVRHLFAQGDAPGLSHYFGMGDVNGDGRPDIASAGKDVPEGNWFAWWEQPVDATGPWRRHWIGQGQLGATNILPADVNGDGKLDFLATRGHGQGVLWFEAPDWTPHEIDEDLVGPHALAIGDLDGDGDIDAATCAKDSQLAVWYENDGKGGFTRHVLGRQQASYDVRLVDMDRDGDLDLVVSGQASENVVWFENRLRP